MIRDTHIAKREEDIGFYAGFVGSAFMFGRASTSVLWGMIADRYGRKPVIIFGTIALVLFNTLFGFSTSFWMAFTTRFLLGSLNGALGPIRAYASEISRPEHQALALSLVSLARGIGLIIGPAIGGFLAMPAEKYPDLISKDSLFGRFPYLLPCLTISMLGLVVLVACFWLPETLHRNHGNNGGDDSYEALEASSNIDKTEADLLGDGQSHLASKKKSLWKNWPLMSSIIVYCIFSLNDMAYTEIFSLWAVSPRKLGGLSFSTDDETLHRNHGNNGGDDSYEALEASSNIDKTEADLLGDGQSHLASKKKSLWKNWPLMSSIIVYCIFSLNDMAYTEIFSLWAVSPRKLGGLSFSTDDVGVVLAISGAGLFTFQTLLYPMAVRLLGPLVVSRITAVLTIPVQQSFPFIAMLSGISLSIVLNFASILKNVFSICIVTGLIVLQNNAVDQHQRAAANGIAMTGMSIFKAFGPAMGGTLFSWAEKRQGASFLPGTHMIFFLLNVITVIGLITTYEPFLVIRAD
ncbi:Zinc induced facilitator-like [Thalictrum thalictroides]|uniref:Zinc induced facilitator-like n=1 Tax=Thalictrum thalictroides TaxID=46969 RepID=A0A7J6WAQ4_THATH|nr:Zinc induced facilitator-like [Thalictrum thalictroides]